MRLTFSLAFAAALAALGCEPARPTTRTPSTGSVTAPVATGPSDAGGSPAPGAPPSGALASQAPRGVAPSAIETRTFASAALGVDKKYVVYLPRGYADSTLRFPVIYLLHGLGGNETNWVTHGGLGSAADALDLRAIVVMPDGDDSFWTNGHQALPYDECLRRKPPFDPSEAPSSYCVRAPRYEDYVTHDLLADVDQSLRTVAERKGRGIAGVSMGGFGAMQLGLRHPELYSAVASHSGLLWLLASSPSPYDAGQLRAADSVAAWGAQYRPELREQLVRVFGPELGNWRAHDPSLLVAKLPTPTPLALYFDCGTEDEFHFADQARHLDRALAERGIPHQFELVPGKHDWTLWKARLSYGLRQLAQSFADAGL